MQKQLLTILLSAFILPVLVQSQQTIKDTFQHNGLTREFIYCAPKALPEKAPLVVVLHGFTSSAETIMNYSEMNTLGNEHNFATVYPQGIKDKNGNTFWNVGYEFHKEVTTDDVDFIVELVHHLQKKYALSVNNTFVTGMSNGGEMCYLLACKYPNVFAATAPVAGTMMQSFFTNCKSTNPIPIMAVFGTKDATTNYSGDTENKDGWGAYQSIPYIINYWIEAIEYTSVQTDTLPDINKQDSSFVISKQYLNPHKNFEFLYYKVINGGHDWPGAWGNKDINTSKEIWRFFEKYIVE